MYAIRIRSGLFFLLFLCIGKDVVFVSGDRYIELLFEWVSKPIHKNLSPDETFNFSGDNSTYFVFSQTWSGGYCIFSKCSFPRVLHSFNIHGLWPTIWPNKEISNCAGAPSFNKTALEDIFGELQKEWADEKNFKNPWKFWHHEWAKHGSCAICNKLISDQHAYFVTALALKKQIDIANIFKKIGIIPSNTTEYNTESVYAMVDAELGVHVILSCEWTHIIEAQLIEVRVCVSWELKLIDCPRNNETVLSLPSDNQLRWTTPCPKTFKFSI